MKKLLALPLLAAVPQMTGCLSFTGSPHEPRDEVSRASFEIKGDHEPLEVSYLIAEDPDLPRVIYIHGTPGDASAFTRYLYNPVEGLEAISIDRPGFGASDPIHAVVSFEEQARAIEPLLVERDGRWPILVGHSLGGPIIARAAADYPDKVGAIVILAGSLDPGLEKPRWFNHAGRFPLVSAFLARDIRNSNKEIMAAKRETELLAEVLDQVRCPIIIIHGEDDILVPIDNVDYMRARFKENPNVDVVILPGENHFIPWTREPLVRDAVERMRDLPNAGAIMVD